jgi:Fe-S-cluster containining protein
VTDALFEAVGERWQITPAALRPIACTPDGITAPGGCGGACCRGTVFWPPRAGDVDGACDHLGPDGCRLGDARPATCHLYPLRPKHRRLIIHHAGAILGAYCGGCRGHGPPIIDALADSLRLLFGAEQADRAIADLHAGRPAYLDVPDRLRAALADEAADEAADRVPRPRDWRAP